MDNIVVMGATKEELKQNTLEVLEILKENHLYLKGSKCLWEVMECPILGYVVGGGRLQMEDDKVKVIKEWK